LEALIHEYPLNPEEQMNWNPRSMMRRVHSLPAHIQELGSYLRELSAQMRESVAQAVGNTVGRAVQDGLTRLFHHPPVAEVSSQRLEPEIGAYDRSDPIRDNDWGLDEPRDDEPRPIANSSTVAPEPALVTAHGLLALALKATGWWLSRRGSWVGALGLGLLVGGIALVGGPIAVAVIGLAEAACEAVALNNLLSTGAIDLNAV
jgi:hypothetical protein